MSSLGIFEIDQWVKGKKFAHAVYVINELNRNIIGIDIIHLYKLMYDVNKRLMIAIANKEAETVADIIFKEWF
jgi:hypothetical protein